MTRLVADDAEQLVGSETPNGSVWMNLHLVDTISRLSVVRSEAEMFKGLAIEAGKTIGTTNPDISLMICSNGVDSIVGHSITHGVVGEALSIEPAETTESTDPQVAELILCHVARLRLDKTILDIKVIERISLRQQRCLDTQQ